MIVIYAHRPRNLKYFNEDNSSSTTCPRPALLLDFETKGNVTRPATRTYHVDFDVSLICQ
jgi:hypothetical protein